MERQIDGETYRWTKRQVDRLTGGQTDGRTPDRWKDRCTER
jgi:hypothetical protein